MLKEITEQENEFIEAIRNFQRAYPNGAKELKRHAKKEFDKMIYREDSPIIHSMNRENKRIEYGTDNNI